MIISVHIPKCGGISFQHVLRGIYGNRRVWLNYGIIFDQAEASARAHLVPGGARVLHGHFLSDTFDQTVPYGELVTWLRHPVERLISNFHHFLRHPDPQNPCCRELWDHGLSLQKFCELPQMRNEMTRYLAGKSLRDFKFVGVMERYQESLRLFGSVFRVSVPFVPPRENVNPSRGGEHYEIPDWLYTHIEELNQADLATYACAVAELERAVAHAGEPWAIPAFTRAPAQASLAGSSAFSLSR